MIRVVLVAALLLSLAGCTGGNQQGVVIDGHAVTFEDGDVTVAVGDTVTFRMVEGSHTVDFFEDDGPVAGVSDAHSGNLDEGDTFTVAFTEPGTYRYFCAYHSSLIDGERAGMIGTITVV